MSSFEDALETIRQFELIKARMGREQASRSLLKHFPEINPNIKDLGVLDSNAAESIQRLSGLSAAEVRQRFVDWVQANS